MPDILLASGSRATVMSTMVDSEIERGHAVTTHRVCGDILGRVSASEIGISIPEETVAGSDYLKNAVAMVEGKVQRVCAWASSSICVVMGIQPSGIVCSPIPVVIITDSSI